MSVLYSDFFSAESSASSIYAELCFGHFFKWNAAAFSPKLITQHLEFCLQMLHSGLLVLLSARESKSTPWRWRFYWDTARLHHQSELFWSHIPTACWTSKHRWCLQMWNAQQYKLICTLKTGLLPFRSLVIKNQDLHWMNGWFISLAV